jgi:hypothetical protein
VALFALIHDVTSMYHRQTKTLLGAYSPKKPDSFGAAIRGRLHVGSRDVVRRALGTPSRDRRPDAEVTLGWSPEEEQRLAGRPFRHRAPSSNAAPAT